MGLLLPHRMLLLPNKPTLVGCSKQVASSSPITLTLPRREAGILLIAFLARHAGGTATPGSPTGWTSLVTNTADPEYRITHKFCDGTEAPTTTSAAASATSLSAIVLAFKGCHSSQAVNTSTHASGTSTAPDSTSVSPTAVFSTSILYLTWAMWNGDADVSSYPGEFSVSPAVARDGTNGGQALIGKYFGGSRLFDPGAFTLSASVLWGARTVFVPGFV